MIKSTISAKTQIVHLELDMKQFAKMLIALRHFEPPAKPGEPERYALRDEVRALAQKMIDRSTLSIPVSELVAAGQAGEFVGEISNILHQFMQTHVDRGHR